MSFIGLIIEGLQAGAGAAKKFDKAGDYWSQDDQRRLGELTEGRGEHTERMRGFSDPQFSNVEDQLMAPYLQEQRSRMQDHRAMLASQGMGAAASAQQAMREEDTTQDAQGKIARQMVDLQLQERRDQLKEAKDLRERKESFERAKRNAASVGLIEFFTGAAEEYGKFKAQEQQQLGQTQEDRDALKVDAEFEEDQDDLWVDVGEY